MAAAYCLPTFSVERLYIGLGDPAVPALGLATAYFLFLTIEVIRFGGADDQMPPTTFHVILAVLASAECEKFPWRCSIAINLQAFGTIARSRCPNSKSVWNTRRRWLRVRLLWEKRSLGSVGLAAGLWASSVSRAARLVCMKSL